MTQMYETLGRASSPLPSAAPDVFEGPEKKLEVFFHPPDAATGFRRFGAEQWSDVLADASCSILRSESNAHFDAYLLSESSLFVYPHKVILKTCGTTTLLLVMPKLLALADELQAPFSHVHYSHLRYKYPELQPFPHSSFDEEQSCLSRALEGRASRVVARVLGPEGGSSAAWYALCADADVQPAGAPASAEKGAKTCPLATGDGAVLEVAMEGLHPAVCATFVGTSPMHKGATGKRLATSMSQLSGIRALVGEATLDDWAFEPCGYSMNALDGHHYSTVHITPENHCSYASFETTDPAFATADKLGAVLAVFQPSRFTLTLTTRTADTSATRAAAAASPSSFLETTADGFALGALGSLDGLVCASNERTRLTETVGVTCATFTSRTLAPLAPLACTSATSLTTADADSSADSESTAGLDEVSVTEGERLGDAVRSESAATDRADDSLSESTPKKRKTG